MGFRVTRLYADDDGDTHLEDLELPTAATAQSNGVAQVFVPVAGALYLEYPDESEIDPGYHVTHKRHLISPLVGAFEVVATSGQSTVFESGDWLLAEDMTGKGHITRAVGEVRRTNLLLMLPDDWQVPTS